MRIIRDPYQENREMKDGSRTKNPVGYDIGGAGRPLGGLWSEKRPARMGGNVIT
jgi:hypothetical protein